MGGTEFDGGEFRQGFGADDLVDLNGGGGFDDFGGGFGGFPEDSVADGLVGAGDLSTGMPGQGGDNYANVGATNKTFSDAMGEFYADEFKKGIGAFGQVFTESMGVMGKLPIGSLGGLWAGWVLLGIIFIPVGTVGFLITQHFINKAGGVAIGGAATARMIFDTLFWSGGLFLASGGIFGWVMTTKLKRGDRTLSGVELEVTDNDKADDEDAEFGSEEDCFGENTEYEEGEDVYGPAGEMGGNPYDAILAQPEEEPEPELEDTSKKVVVQNLAPEVISRSLDNINDMSVIGNPKEAIFKLALDILPCYNPSFTDVKNIEAGSDQWNTLEHFVLNSIKIVTGAESDDITTRIKEIKKSAMSYSIVASRFSKMKSESQLKQFDEELKGFLDSDSGAETSVSIGDAPQVTCQTVAKGNDYLISIIMPSKKLISLGDVFHTDAFQKYMKSGKKMPVCLGLNNAGQMVTYDAKPDSGIMLCGQTRSGKSWFTMYYLLNFMILQSPMEHQFILIDPKATGLFDTMSLMPHIMGLHCPSQDDPEAPRQILALLEELIYTEGERRKALFKEKGYENYWDFIAGEGADSLPLITLVMDEYFSIMGMFKETKNTLGEDLTPQFKLYINNLLTKLPAYGLRILIIPHRVPGLVDPLTRDMMKFKATFRSAEDLSEPNLGQSKVGIPLPNAGDMAWTSEMQTKPMYTHTLCVGKDDNTMKDTLVLIAKAYYKLGVDIPDMSYMPRCFTRDDEKIVEKIKSFGK